MKATVFDNLELITLYTKRIISQGNQRLFCICRHYTIFSSDVRELAAQRLNVSAPLAIDNPITYI